jgi:arsenate reductase-like glutaredoxin family protein
MNIQIIGTRKCRDTRKAERFFKERQIPFHYRDLNIKGVSKGELNNITRVIQIEELLNREGKQYKKRNLEFKVYNTEDELLNDPLLLKTPIVRNGNLVTLGYQPKVWNDWIKNI